MTKVKDPYLTIINAKTAYNADDFKQFEYDEIAVSKGDRGKTSSLIEKQSHIALNQAISELESYGMTVTVNSAYRDLEDQQYAIDEFYKKELVDNGNNHELAKKETDEYCAKVGHSEHHTGLAVDLVIPTANAIIPDKIKSLYNSPKYDGKLGFIFKRLVMEKYGFILTYPKDDRIEDVTGMKHNEGWHWRYIGVNHSQMIAKIRNRVNCKVDKDYEIFLEDYVELLNMQTYAIDEEQYIEEISDLFISKILKLENENTQTF